MENQNLAPFTASMVDRADHGEQRVLNPSSPLPRREWCGALVPKPNWPRLQIKSRAAWFAIMGTGVPKALTAFGFRIVFEL